MKLLFPLLFLFLIISPAGGKEKTFTGSTPAGLEVRDFLGILLSDSVDFIRWKLTLFDNRYELACQYGIGLANTNGFINGGTQVELKGDYRKEKNYYHFRNGTKSLRGIALNADLLHLLDPKGRLLVGNAGWSYTLNHTTPLNTTPLSLPTATRVLNDSMLFEGRTPCNVPHVIAPGSLCYKIKWQIAFYADAQLNKPRSYKISGTPWRREGVRTGSWKIVNGPNEQLLYQLNDEKGAGLLFLLKIDEHILVFTDAQGKLLVGNEDFSYTLSRRW